MILIPLFVLFLFSMQGGNPSLFPFLSISLLQCAFSSHILSVFEGHITHEENLYPSDYLYLPPFPPPLANITANEVNL